MRLLDAYLEPIPTDDPEDARIARLVIGLNGVAIVAGLVYGPIYALVGAWLPLAGAVSAVILGSYTLARFRRDHDGRVAAHLLGLIPLVALGCVTAGTGGLVSPANAWLVLCLVMPGMLLGLGAGVRWALVAIGWMTLEYGLATVGWTLPDQLEGAGIHNLFSYVVPVGLIVALSGVLTSYESARTEGERLLHEARLRAESARDEAEEARDSSQRLLATVSDGLLFVAVDGAVGAQTSNAAHRMLGTIEAGTSIWEVIRRHDPQQSEWWEMGWMDLGMGFMPPEVVLEQLPSELQVDGRTLEVSARPAFEDGELTGVMVVFADVTSARSAAKAQAVQSELMQFFLSLQSDPLGLQSFLIEARSLVERIDAGGSQIELRRWLHTLKGNMGSFGLESWARWLHELEDLSEAAGEVSEATRSSISRRWRLLEGRVAPLLASSDAVPVPRSELDVVLRLARSGVAATELADRIEHWTIDRVGRRLEQLAERGRTEAARAERDNVTFEVGADNTPLPQEPSLGAFWGALVHVVRNAIDHGVESREERRAQGKPEQGTVQLLAYTQGVDLVVEIRDDGRGVDWESIDARAKQLGLPVGDQEGRIRALFADGLSTAETVGALSGRGVGTSAVLQETENLGGLIHVATEPGEGTSFRFVLPVLEDAAGIVSA